MQVVALFFFSTIFSSCLHQRQVDTRAIVSKRSIQSKYLLPELDLSLLPDNSSPLWKVVHTSILQKNYAKVEDEISRFLQNNPGHVKALSILMQSLFLQKKYSLAGYYARVILSIDNTNDDAHMIDNLVVIVSPDSYNYQRKAAELRLASLFTDSKSHIASGLNLAIWMLKKGNCKKAMQLFSQVSKRCPACGITKIGFAICLLRTDKIARAHNLLLEINKDTEDALARYYLAFTYLKIKKDLDKAREILKTILNDNAQDGHIRNKARSLLILIQNQSVARRNQSS